MNRKSNIMSGTVLGEHYYSGKFFHNNGISRKNTEDLEI